MRIVDMRRSDMEGNIKAFFKVETEDGLVIDGFKVMNGKNGLFASMPSKKVGEKFIETVTAPREVKDKLSRLALEEYKTLDAGGPQPTARDLPPMPPPQDTDLPF